MAVESTRVPTYNSVMNAIYYYLDYRYIPAISAESTYKSELKELVGLATRPSINIIDSYGGWRFSAFAHRAYMGYYRGKLNELYDKYVEIADLLVGANNRIAGLEGANAGLIGERDELQRLYDTLGTQFYELYDRFTDSRLDFEQRQAALGLSYDEAMQKLEEEEGLLDRFTQNIIENTIALATDSEFVESDLTRGIGDWKAEFDTLSEQIIEGDNRTTTIQNRLNEPNLSVSDRNNALEELAYIALSTLDIKNKAESVKFTIEGLERQSKIAKDASDTFMDAIRGTGEEIESKFVDIENLNNFAETLGNTIKETTDISKQFEIDLGENTKALADERAFNAAQTIELNTIDGERLLYQEKYNEGLINIQELENKNLELEQKKKELEGTVTYGKVMRQIDEDDAAMGELIDEGEDISSIDFSKSIPEMPDATEPADLSEAISPSFNQSIGYAMGVQSEQPPQPQLTQAPSDERIVPEVPMPDAPIIRGTLVKASAVPDALRKKNEAETGIGSFLA